MKRFKSIVVLLFCIMLLLAACNRHEDIRDIITDASDGEGDNIAASGNAGRNEIRVPDISEEKLKKEADEDRHIMSDNPEFKDCGILLGSENLTLPFSYKRISDEWTFNLSDYGFDEDFKLGPGERTSDTIHLIKEDAGYEIIVGLYNPYDVKCTVEEAYVYSLTIDRRETGEEYPIIKLPGGLTWGATFKEIIEVAHPTEGFTVDEEKQEMYLSFTYDYENYYMLTVSETRGIMAVTIKSYAKTR